MTEVLQRQIVAWATEIATRAAQLPSREAREAYVLERRRELLAGLRNEGLGARDAEFLADTCTDAARRILSALIARGTAVSEGRA
jgi:hypothetical protein